MHNVNKQPALNQFTIIWSVDHSLCSTKSLVFKPLHSSHTSQAFNLIPAARRAVIILVIHLSTAQRKSRGQRALCTPRYAPAHHLLQSLSSLQTHYYTLHLSPIKIASKSLSCSFYLFLYHHKRLLKQKVGKIKETSGVKRQKLSWQVWIIKQHNSFHLLTFCVLFINPLLVIHLTAMICLFASEILPPML